MADFFVSLYEHPQSLAGGGRKLDLNVTADGYGGIPLDEIEKYFKAGTVSPITSVRWCLPSDSCVELYPGRFWKGAPCVLAGNGKEQVIDLRTVDFDDKTRSAMVRRNHRSPWCVRIISRPTPNLGPAVVAAKTIWASNKLDALRQAANIHNEFGGRDFYDMSVSEGDCNT